MDGVKCILDLVLQPASEIPPNLNGILSFMTLAFSCCAARFMIIDWELVSKDLSLFRFVVCFTVISRVVDKQSGSNFDRSPDPEWIALVKVPEIDRCVSGGDHFFIAEVKTWKPMAWWF